MGLKYYKLLLETLDAPALVKILITCNGKFKVLLLMTITNEHEKINRLTLLGEGGDLISRDKEARTLLTKNMIVY